MAVGGPAAVLAAVLVAPSAGYQRYNDGCQSCHGAFTGPVSPKPGVIFPQDSKHQMHRSSSAMNTECDLCHTDGDDHNPFLASSNGTAANPGIGCTGCHGRDYGPGYGNKSAGLRRHHFVHNVTFCVGCHPDDPPETLPESVAPTYYGTVDTNVGDPCNSGPGFLEDWTLDAAGIGLDNDGDDAYDQDDPDCAPPPPCPADLDGTGDAGFSDLLLILGAWGPCPGCPEDLDMTGDVGFSDLLFLLGDWGPCP